MKKPGDPMQELRAIKRELSRELTAAHKKGRLGEKMREIERRNAKLIARLKKKHVGAR